MAWRPCDRHLLCDLHLHRPRAPLVYRSRAHRASAPASSAWRPSPSVPFCPASSPSRNPTSLHPPPRHSLHQQQQPFLPAAATTMESRICRSFHRCHPIGLPSTSMPSPPHRIATASPCAGTAPSPPIRSDRRRRPPPNQVIFLSKATPPHHLPGCLSTPALLLTPHCRA
jgi:hypothetical protein